MMREVGSFDHVLAVDLGSTHCRMAIVDKVFTIVHEKQIPTDSIEDFYAVINDYLEEVSHKDIRVEAGVFGVAGVVIDDAVSLTHADLTISKQELLDTTALVRVELLNDAQAAGYAIGSYDLASGMYVLITIGTGLGVTPVLVGDRTVALPSQAGHVRVHVSDELIKAWSIRLVRPVKWDDVLSGSGFSFMHEYLTGDVLAAKDVKDEETLTRFASYLQLFLREIGVMFLPQKIYLAGGVVHQRKDLFTSKMKPVVDVSLTDEIPVAVIDNDQLGIVGGAFYLRRMIDA